MSYVTHPGLHLGSSDRLREDANFKELNSNLQGRLRHTGGIGKWSREKTIAVS